MTMTSSARSSPNSKIRDVLAAGRRHIGTRWGLLVLAGLAFALGMVFKWNWLVAAGIAPVLVSLLPSAAMCALGFCMHKAVGSSAAPKPPSPGAEPNSKPDRTN
jgi:hypothetical protein